MFSSMKLSKIGRVIVVAALASTALSLVPQEAAAGFRFGGFGGGMRMGGFGGGMRMGGFSGGMRGFGGGHVPGFFGSHGGGFGGGFGGARMSQGFGERRFTQNGGFGGTRGMAKGGFGGRNAPHGGFAGRDVAKGGFAGRHQPHGGFAGRPVSKGSRLAQRPQVGPHFPSNGGGKPAFATHPPTSHGPTGGLGQRPPQVAGIHKPGNGPKGPGRQFGRLGPASIGFGLGLFQPVVDPDAVVPVAPDIVAAPIVAPAYEPVVAPPTPVDVTPVAPVAVNPVPVPEVAPRAFVATAPVTAPAATVPGAPAACGIGSFVTVAFQANLTTSDVKTFLEAYNVAIVAGPEADGTYKIQLSACPLTPEEMTQVVDSMRTQTALVSKVDA